MSEAAKVVSRTSRDMIRCAARNLGWQKVPSRFPLCDNYTHKGHKLTVYFDITGRCRPGGIAYPASGLYEPTFVNNRIAALRILKDWRVWRRRP